MSGTPESIPAEHSLAARISKLVVQLLHTYRWPARAHRSQGDRAIA